MLWEKNRFYDNNLVISLPPVSVIKINYQAKKLWGGWGGVEDIYVRHGF